jgi:hypothetical protein
VGHLLHAWPHRRLAHGRDELGWETDRGRQEVLDGIAAAAGRDARLELGDVVVRQRRPTVVDEEVRLPQRELPDRQTAERCGEREVAAGRAAIEECRAAGFLD